MTNYLEQYFTPPEVTSALLARLPLHRGARVLEPCAGDGWISRNLPENVVVTTGDFDPGMAVDYPGVDFFSRRARELYRDSHIIITNPPWSNAARFVRRALQITPNVATLLRLTFLEPCDANDDSRRVDLLKALRAHIVLPRTSFIKGKRGTDSVPPCWFIWGFDWLSHDDLPAFDIVTNDELARHAGQQDLLSLMPAGVSEAVVLVPEGDLPERPKRLRSRSLEPEQIRQIRRLHDLGCKQIEIARKFGVHSATIRQITLGETYKDVV